MRRDCEHGSLARSCEVCDLRAEVVRLTDGIERAVESMAGKRTQDMINRMDGDVSSEAIEIYHERKKDLYRRFLLDVATDDREATDAD